MQREKNSESKKIFHSQILNILTFWRLQCADKIKMPYTPLVISLVLAD